MIVGDVLFELWPWTKPYPEILKYIDNELKVLIA